MFVTGLGSGVAFGGERVWMLEVAQARRQGGVFCRLGESATWVGMPLEIERSILEACPTTFRLWVVKTDDFRRLTQQRCMLKEAVRVEVSAVRGERRNTFSKMPSR